MAQITEYNYARDINNISDEWHTINLPDVIFSKLNATTTDLRIYGLTKKDTIEAPYILNIKSETETKQHIAFKTINNSKTDSGYYFTFKIESPQSLNQINLNFKNNNFDWRIKLEGSQNLNTTWFSILEDYRLLSINNNTTNFKHTTLNFAASQYNYYRLFIKTEDIPELINAYIFKTSISTGDFKTYAIKSKKITNNKKRKQTELLLDLEQSVPISHLKLNIKDDFDYYRPITISYLKDSIKTEKGWKHQYKTIYNGTLNTLETNGFHFKNTITKNLKIAIKNGNNQALTVDSAIVKGNVYQIIARFNKPANYVLAYGNTSASKPNYDIARFTNRIPKNPTLISLGKVQSLTKAGARKTQPLFKNKFWLWAIIAVIIITLGVFTIKMMKEA